MIFFNYRYIYWHGIVQNAFFQNGVGVYWNYCFVSFAVQISICSTVSQKSFSKWYEINNFSWIWFNSLKNHRMWCHRSMRTVIIICNNLVQTIFVTIIPVSLYLLICFTKLVDKVRPSTNGQNSINTSS